MRKKIKYIILIASIIPVFSMGSRIPIDKIKEKFIRDHTIPYPEINPYSLEKENLGRRLFFDRKLSKTKKVFCGGCHVPIKAWEDYLSLSIGEGQERLKRSTPTIMNLAWSKHFFWDGRANSLEDQIEGPITNKLEMNLTFKELEKRLKEDPEYPALFETAFPKTGINKKTISYALATFIRGIVSYKAPFDLWIEGNENAISNNAKNGFLIFNTKARCVTCHSGWRFTDDKFYDIGLDSPDIGRGIIDNNFNYAFKTPTLREISKRSPYMHDSSIATLEDVIEYFNKGGHRKLMKPLKLTVLEKRDLVEFLKTLFSLKKENIPPLIHRELYLGRERSRHY